MQLTGKQCGCANFNSYTFILERIILEHVYIGKHLYWNSTLSERADIVTSLYWNALIYEFTYI